MRIQWHIQPHTELDGNYWYTVDPTDSAGLRFCRLWRTEKNEALSKFWNSKKIDFHLKIL